MNPEAAPSSPVIEWGVAGQALPGQAESGDQHLVQPFPYGLLVAVVDGLGHGGEAAAAARAAVGILGQHADEPLVPLIERCHEGLLSTRGVVMSLASFNSLHDSMTWLGVGNVESLLLHADARAGPRSRALLLRGGVVGYQLPLLRTAVLPVARGDTLILATDGIRRGFADRLVLRGPPQQIADGILAEHGMGTDDALVLVARYLGDTL